MCCPDGCHRRGLHDYPAKICGEPGRSCRLRRWRFARQTALEAKWPAMPGGGSAMIDTSNSLQRDPRFAARGGYSRLEGLRTGSTGSRATGLGASGAGTPPGLAAATSPYPPQYRVPVEPSSACTPQKSLGRMTTSRRTIARPLRSSTVRCPSGPIMTKAVDKVRRPWASAGESARLAGAGFSASDTGSRDSRAAVPGTGLGLCIVASLGGGLQAASAALHGSKRQGITPFASLNTAFATGTAPSSHWAGGVCVGRDREGAKTAVRQLTAGRHRIFCEISVAYGRIERACRLTGADFPRIGVRYSYQIIKRIHPPKTSLHGVAHAIAGHRGDHQ